MSAITEAVMFFRKGDVVKEMYYTEFEAVLDDVVGIDDFSGEEIRAVFLQINSQLKLISAVFFLISFDEKGRVPRSWNIPLRQLADFGSQGPDLGAGPIRIACSSACPEEWYRKQLWDPDMGVTDTFRALTSAAERNRLGILTDRKKDKQSRNAPRVFGDYAAAGQTLAAKTANTNDDAEPAKADTGVSFNRDYRRKREAWLAEHRLALATQAQEFRKRLEKVENTQAEKLASRDAANETLQNRLDDTTVQLKRIEGQLQRYRKLIDEKTAELEAAFSQGGADSPVQVEELRQQYLKETERQIADLRLEYETRVQKREQELFGRATEIVELRAELNEVTKQNHQLMSSDDHIVDEMVKKGVVFVAYHPGIEHVLIDKDEMPDYLADPVAFAAARCEVSRAQYNEWLTHYRLPICRALEDGHYCGHPVDKVMRPRLFLPGESDRCDHHRHPQQEPA